MGRGQWADSGSGGKALTAAERMKDKDTLINQVEAAMEVATGSTK